MTASLRGKHAVVIGASAAGMLAAKALSEHFARVTVIERDTLPNESAIRKGVPQGAHAHAFLARGLQIVQRLFPGLTDDMVAHGAIWADTAADSLWYQFGTARLRTESGLLGLFFTRPLLDWRMRTHLLRDPRMTIRDGYRVKDLRFTPDKRAVTGLFIEPINGNGLLEEVTADLVVDCGGRGTQTPLWLETNGLGTVPVSEVKAKVDYASCLYKAPTAELDWKIGMIITTPPETTLAVAFAVEGGHWVVTLQSMFGEPLPGDHEGILNFLKRLPRPEIYEAIRRSEPVGPIYRHSSPSNLRHHYEKVERFPEGLVVVGDAACCFNPRYGQGMTTASLAVDLLERCLSDQPAGTLDGLSRRFHQRLVSVLDLPWQVSTGEDLRFQQVEGPRPMVLKLINGLLVKIFQLASVDREALLAVLQVQNMLKPISAILKPGIIWRALTFRAPKPEARADLSATLR